MLIRIYSFPSLREPLFFNLYSPFFIRNILLLVYLLIYRFDVKKNFIQMNLSELSMFYCILNPSNYYNQVTFNRLVILYLFYSDFFILFVPQSEETLL